MGNWTRGRAWLLPVVVGLVFSGIFIARTMFTAEGQLYSTLFDDAMISMRYAKNLAGGHGLVWNADGAPVEGYSNFLWVLWMAVPHLLRIPMPLTSLALMLSSAVLLSCTTVVTGAIVNHIAPDQPIAVRTAMWLTALCYPLAFWSLRGMEVGLVAAVLSASFLFALRLMEQFTLRRAILLGGLLAIGTLIRDDVALACAIVAIWTVASVERSERRRVAMVLLGLMGGAIAAHLIFRIAFYGQLVPNTYHLKLGGVRLATRMRRGLAALLLTGVTQLGTSVVLAGVAVLGRRQRPHPGILLLVAVLAGQSAYSIYVGGDAWEWMGYANRYLAPVLPALFVLVGLGVSLLIERPPNVRRWVAPAAGALATGLVVVNASRLLPVGLLQLKAPSFDLRLARSLMGASVAALLLYMAVRQRRRAWPPVFASRLGAALVFSLLLAANGVAFGRWARDNAAVLAEDRAWTRYGLGLRRATGEDASIAVAAAGSIPYFTDRRMLDLLGKNDPVIAHREPKPVTFLPGHVKWDYSYSIATLRPDVVAQLFGPTPTDNLAIVSAGYEEILPGMLYVRAGDASVDGARLRQLKPLVR